MNVETLSRIQFGVTSSFHFVFPPMTIGLGLFLVILQALRVWTKQPIYLELARFWTKVFGLIFAIGVATGIPLEFQFGTNWAHYARFVGDIFGSPLAIEGIYAFFMESGFLALLLFGWNKIGPKMHLFATFMVALGAHFSAIWILVANSWMQTPAGFHLARQMKVTTDGAQFPMTADLGNTAFTVKEIPLPQGYVIQPPDLGYVRAVIDNFSAAIFNHTTLVRLAHTILACWIIGAFVVVAISAWWLLKNKFVAEAKISLKISLIMATAACLLQMQAGDFTARGVATFQPTKLAAMEGIAHTEKQAPLGLFGWISWQRDAQGNITGIEPKTIGVPGMLSVLVSGDFLHPMQAAQTEVKGLADLPSDELLRARHPGATDAELAALRPKYWPPVPVLFQVYHLMIGLGVLLLLVSLLGCWWLKTGRLWNTQDKFVRWFLGALVLCPFLAHVATQAGWFTAELGRQPWTVYEVLKTSESVSVAVHAPQVLSSIIMFTIIYLLLTALFVTLLSQKIKHGPQPVTEVPNLPEKWQPLSHRAGRQLED